MAYIIYKSEKYELNNELTIGRDIKNDLSISIRTISRNHAVIRLIGDKHYIIDMGSFNGTFLNSKPVTTPTLLEDKSIVQCGDVQIVFYDGIEQELDETILTDSSNFVVESIVMVADIKGYTSYSESTSIQVVSKMMSQWLKEVNKSIEKSNGFIDSFIGDCVYARWDGKTDKQTLLDVLDAVKYISIKTKDISSLDIGVGIHIGEVIVGAGTNNTGLGDTVNATFRLEKQTRELDTDIVISQKVFELLDIDKPLVDIELKGKSEVMKVCSIKFEDI